MKRASGQVLACVLLWCLGTGIIAGAAPWRFAATCDSRGSSYLNQVNTNVLREIASAIVEDDVEVVVFAGDLVYGYPATPAAFSEWTNAMAPVYEAGIGVYPVRGNHDVGTGWQEVLGHALPTNGPPAEIGMTFAFTNRNALFLALDNYSGSLDYFNAPISIDAGWVQQQLASNSLPHVFAYGHSPAFKVRHWDCLDDVRPARDAFWRSLTEAGAKAYFCGHDHFYDHSRLDDGDGNPVNDVHQYVAGTAGAPLYDWSPYDGDNGPWTPTRMFYDRVHGYIIGEIDGSRVTMTWKRREAPGVYVATETFRYDVEASAPRTRYVSPHGLHISPYDDWTTAATTIQAAVEATVDWDTVLVTNGIYDSGRSEVPNGMPCRVVVVRDVEVRSVRGASATAIVGQGPLGSNAVRCAYLGGRGRLTGFALRGGHTYTNGSVNLAMSGAGLWCEGESTVADCVIAENEAAALGGGAYVAGGRLLNCVVHRNRAQHGGGVFCWQGGVLSHCTVSGNDVTATLLGGGGGVHLYGGGSVINSVVHLNRGHTNANWHTHLGGSISFTCTAPLPTVTCITEPPGFAGAHAGNYRLTIDSPCIDRASPVPTARRDIDDTPRPLDGNADGTGIADMGAYEFVHAAADTDGDMLLDFDELDLFHTDPTVGDTDGDRMGDGREIRAGTDPLDASSLLRVTQCKVLTNGPNTVIIRWHAVAGRRYAVYKATNLVAAGWSLLGQVQAGFGGSHSFTSAPSAGPAFYRVAVEEP
jgi:hypothetical protein